MKDGKSKDEMTKRVRNKDRYKNLLQYSGLFLQGSSPYSFSEAVFPP